ncbi:MAG: hypothetical protein WC891_02770 [Actinomycetota bacterium]
MSAKYDDQIFISGLVFKEGNQWTSLCLQYDVSSQGENPLIAIENNIEAAHAYLDACYDEGKSLEDCWRPAPISYWCTFSWLTLRDMVRRRKLQTVDKEKTFRAPLAFAA